ncbi:MAG: nitroreductase family protein, partial [Bacteroidota bacterium]|nr:nitroreductase family protein [Bacteroidota bacterium]
MDRKEIKGQPFIRYEKEMLSEEESRQRSEAYFELMKKRRSVREFSDKPIPKAIIQNILGAANSAPSGANKQPWTFCVVSNPELKKQIREAAEKEEFQNYHGRMNSEWLENLKAFGTDHIKEFLETAPYLIVVFKRAYETDELGHKHQ